MPPPAVSEVFLPSPPSFWMSFDNKAQFLKKREGLGGEGWVGFFLASGLACFQQSFFRQYLPVLKWPLPLRAAARLLRNPEK